MTKRRVVDEMLDHLPADDSRARHSRRDLQRVNALMGNARILSRALHRVRPENRACSIVELGAGDGTLLLEIARVLGRQGPPVRATLIDRMPLLSARTRAEFDGLGWHVDPVETDVFTWLHRSQAGISDVTIANLFLHHFREADLTTLLDLASRQTRCFLACEPRRSHVALAGATMLPLIGCNAVTRHDAKASVRAGFRQEELTRLWPRDRGWRLTERRNGLFTHAFAAHHEEAA